jgi:hypothetical protein
VVLEVFHYDICGLMRLSFVSGARHFLLFVNDFSRNMWVYFRKKKSDAFVKIKTIREKQKGINIF